VRIKNPNYAQAEGGRKCLKRLVCAALPENLQSADYVSTLYGLPVGAAQRITWDMVSKDRKQIELTGEITKSGEPLRLPLVSAGLDE
jgi:hypothetical protein